MEGMQSDRVDWTCEHCNAHRFTCVECGDLCIDDDDGGELCERCFTDRKPARVEALEIALRAALSFVQDRHPSHDDGHAQMVIAAIRGALRKERD